MADAADQFDPYLKWLGIRDPERPPNHYRLLGVELFEADPEVIAAAADRQMAHVRRFQHGAHVDLSQQLLNQLASAKVCLLRTDSKAAYDRVLGNAMELARVSAIIDRPAGSIKETPARRKGPAIGYSLVGIALATSAVLLMIWRGEARDDRPKQTASKTAPDRPSPDATAGDPKVTVEEAQPETVNQDVSASRPDANEKKADEEIVPPAADVPIEDSRELRPLQPLVPANSAPRLRRPGEAGRQAVDPRSLPPARPPAHSPGQRIDAEQAMAEGDEPFTFIGLDSGGSSESSPGTFARIRKAMQTRDLDQAESLLEQLRQESGSYTQREAAEQMWLVFFQLTQFWKAVEKGISLMKPGVELTVAGQVVKVVESHPHEIVFQVGEKRSTMTTDRTSIDGGLAMTLATIHYLRQGASPQPAVAAFLAVDRAGDPKLAGEIWREMRSRNMAAPLLGR